MKRIIVNTLLIFIITEWSAALAQTEPAIQFDYADSLFESENYFEAVTEFKRLTFFDRDGIYSYEANYKIGLSYKYGAFYENAVRYFMIAGHSAVTPDQEFDAKIEVIRVNILRRTSARAHRLLDELEEDARFDSRAGEIFYWRGWNYMFEDKWSEAALSFDEIDPGHPLKKLALRGTEEKYSVTFARVISYILPGSGQIYTGNYLSGAMSFGWNLLWGYLTVKAFSDNRALDGILIGSLLWLRFYRGNVQNAEKLAIEENITVSNKALKYLMENYKGIKP